jgi:enoyl-CoA hydratase
MAFETLLCESRNAIGFVTINRPERLNALNRQLMLELQTCFQAIRNDAEVRVVILTGSGHKAFAAGADIGELATQSTAVEGRETSELGQRVLSLIENLGKPVIAAINGYALGGGCELAMACTLRIAADTAMMGLPEVKLGLIPGYGGTQRLSHLIGKSRALEIILTGDSISAQEAFRLGLVNQVVPIAELPGASEKLARKIIANAPLAVEFALQSVNRGSGLPIDQGQSLESTLFALCFSTKDKKEGTRAFLDKRRPNFTGQ